MSCLASTFARPPRLASAASVAAEITPAAKPRAPLLVPPARRRASRPDAALSKHGNMQRIGRCHNWVSAVTLAFASISVSRDSGWPGVVGVCLCSKLASWESPGRVSSRGARPPLALPCPPALLHFVRSLLAAAGCEHVTVFFVKRRAVIRSAPRAFFRPAFHRAGCWVRFFLPRAGAVARLSAGDRPRCHGTAPFSSRLE